MKHLIIIILGLAPLSSIAPAHADLAPPRIEPHRAPRPTIPSAVKSTFERLERALRGGDEEAARAEMDGRGWDVNLVGGSGNPLASFVAQGIRKHWFPQGKWDTFKRVGGAIIVTADIVQTEDARVSDQVDVLLVEHGGRWSILGIGESRGEVEALAERLAAKKPLAPPEESP